MSSKENKKLAQQRRAEERKKEQNAVVRKRITIGVIVIAFIGFLVFMTIKNPETKESTDDTTENTTSSTTTSGTDTTQGSYSLDTTEGRVIEDGDTVAIDYVGKKDGVAFDGGTGSTDLEIGSGRFVAGFEDALIGHSVGETFDINLTMPEDYTEELAGEEVVFTVTVNGIYEQQSEE